MKFLILVVKVIILLTVLYYGSSYLFEHMEPPIMNYEKGTIPRPDTAKGGKPNLGTPGTTPETSGPTPIIKDSIEKGTAPETTKPEPDLAKAKQIVLARFSKGDLVVLRSLAKDGLTKEEKSKALAIIRSRLTKEEYELLYHRYYLPYVKNKLNN